MHRTLSVLAWCVAIAVAALGMSASSAAAGDRYWRHGGHIQLGGGYVQVGHRGWGCSGGGTDCPTAINRPGSRAWRGQYRDHWGPGNYWGPGDYRVHRKYRGHRKFRGHVPRFHGPQIYLGIPFVTPHFIPRPHYRGVGLGVAHVRWCKANYRSYRVSDNTFKPRAGKPRKQCWSPYS